MKFYPSAYTKITGNADHPALRGTAYFYPVPSGGVLIETEIFNLPYKDAAPYSQFYAMHIHETGDCSLPFDKTGPHYNPGGLPHPQHAGDLPRFSVTGATPTALFIPTALNCRRSSDVL